MDAQTQAILASAQYPETEAEIIALQPGWAEQSPDQWWEMVKQAVLKCHAAGDYDSHDIRAIGIAYQMHGLVLADREQHVLRNSIIWCDSRAVETGNRAFEEIGEEQCLNHLLNSPGNFTAAKLAWVKHEEPALYARARHAMLPGDFIAMKLTGQLTTTVSALSEGIFWDFRQQELSQDILAYFGFNPELFPPLSPVFSVHGTVSDKVAQRLSLRQGIPVTYKAGDQPNNALALNVFEPGEVAATAGTSGVIYGISEKLHADPLSRINSFAHVNHTDIHTRIGILLCINGTGIFNRWIRDRMGAHYSYAGLNEAAAAVAPGAEGLIALPFGNGAERMLGNRIIGAHFHNLDFNIHGTGHLVRAVQEGIAFAMRYGLDIMRENGMNPSVIRAGRANMFLSEVFTQTFANTSNVSIEFYDGDGSYGAAIGAGIGAGVYTVADAFRNRQPLAVTEPRYSDRWQDLYNQWKAQLELHLQAVNHEGTLVDQHF